MRVEFEVSGGLGNQILCLAAALCYSNAQKNYSQLNLGRYFDPIGLSREHPGHSNREYELSNFELTSDRDFLATEKITYVMLEEFIQQKGYELLYKRYLEKYLSTLPVDLK